MGSSVRRGFDADRCQGPGAGVGLSGSWSSLSVVKERVQDLAHPARGRRGVVWPYYLKHFKKSIVKIYFKVYLFSDN